MDAVRCPECGDVRWSFFGFGPRATPMTCELCGAEMLPERRRPSAMRPPEASAAARERRQGVLAHAGHPTAPPAA
jgi:hypothetical protein